MRCSDLRVLGVAGLAALSVPLLSACGGSSSGTSSAANGSSAGVVNLSSAVAASLTLSGVVIGNAPIANAAVTLTDANGSILTTTADASGHYSFILDSAAHPAPYGLLATDPAFGNEAQYSFVFSLPVYANTVTANITPLSTATVAGLFSSGNPQDVTKLATLTAVTASDLDTSELAIRHVLQNMLVDAGVSATVDLISEPITADHTGLAKVLDQVRADYVGTGEQLFNLDLLPGTYQAPRLAKGNLATVQAATAFAIDPTAAGVIRADNFATIRSSLQACLALPPAERVSGDTLAGACQDALAADFLDGGKTFAQSAAIPLTTAAFTNATVADPRVVYAESASRALLRLTVTPASGVAWTSAYIAEKVDGKWVLRGDQLPYAINVQSFLAERWGYASGWTAPTHQYYSGLTFDVPASIPNISYAVVTGPGLPAAGLTLAPSAATASASLVVDNKTGTAPAAPNTTPNPSSGFQLDFGNVSASGVFTPYAWTAPAVNQSDKRVTDFTAYKSFPVYTFTLHFADGSTQLGTKRLEYAPKAASAASGYTWAHLTGDWQTLLSPGQQTATEYAVSWAGAPLTGMKSVSVRVNSATAIVRGSVDLADPAANSATLIASAPEGFPGNTTSASLNLYYRTPGSIYRYNWYSYTAN